MSGRPEILVRIYKKQKNKKGTNVYKRIRYYKTMNNFKRDYGDSLYVKLSQKKTIVTGDNEIASIFVLSELECRRFYKRANSKNLLTGRKKRFEYKPIQMFDMDENMICEFRNHILASEILGIPTNSILSSIRSEKHFQTWDFAFKEV